MLLSVIIPNYNNSEYLKRCLDSIINNTYSNLEIIIIDDASTDNSVDIINSYKDKRIRLIKNKTNLGAGKSRNIGIKLSKGSYITFIDSDDYVDLDYFSYLISLTLKYDASLVCSNTTIKNEQVITKNIIDYLFTFKIDMASHSKLYKKELFQNIYFSNTRNYEDILFTSKMFLKSKRVVVSNLVKYHYTNNSKSLSNSNYYEYLRVINSKKLDNLVCSNYSKFYYYYNCLGYLNKTIKFNNIDYEFNKKIKKEIINNIKYLFKLDYSLRRKVELIIFCYFNKLYISLYRCL